MVSGGLYPGSHDVWNPRADPEANKEKDPFDARPKGEWRSLYPQPIHRLISQEWVYLAGCFGLGLVISAGAMVQHYGYGVPGLPSLPSRLSRLLADGALAFGAGMVGGTLFGLKWLYHSVAKGIWHLDRRLWRLSTPWISAGLALAVLALLRSDALRLFNPVIVRSPGGVFGVSFLVGYFSDITIGKLNELADVLFAPGRGEKGVSRYSVDPYSSAARQENGKTVVSGREPSGSADRSDSESPNG
jgi:hypothetical protein